MSPILVEPGNPHDFTAEELDELAAEIRAAEPATEVEIAQRPERGYGVTFVEVINLWLQVSEVVGGTATAIASVGAAVQWARKRWQRDKDDNPDRSPRPRAVVLYGPDGQQLKTVKIDMPDGEPVEEAPDSGAETRARPDAG